MFFAQLYLVINDDQTNTRQSVNSTLTSYSFSFCTENRN